MLTPSERQRYARHLILPEIGEAGQLALKKSAVLIVGAGGLGSPAALYLAAAGVGRIGLVDFDNVDTSNLHRQILYGTGSVGSPKLDAARVRLNDLNPDVAIETHPARLTSQNALDIIASYDIVVDGTDNFPTRYLVNDACVLLGKANAYGSIFRFDGQASLFYAKRGPCYRCLYPDPPPPNLVPSCAEAGVLGVLPGIIGSIQAAEAIKLITGAGETLIGRLLLFDALQMNFRTLRLRKDPECKVCSDHPTVTKLIDYEEFCSPGGTMEMTVSELAAKREGVTLIDVREQHEWDISHLEGAKHIPLKQLPARIDEVPRDADVVIYCAVGGRSAHAVHFLRQAGYERVRNLIGGIKAWAREVDPAMPVY